LDNEEVFFCAKVFGQGQISITQRGKSAAPLGRQDNIHIQGGNKRIIFLPMSGR
jgi:hypothetical protein